MTIFDKDVCVIGSGFGGGVAALRHTQAGRSVVVLETGHRWDGRAGSKQFQQTQGDLAYWTDLYSTAVGVDFEKNSASIVASGRGLGGGSLVYSMVSLRAPSIAFDDPVWPDEVDRRALDPYYERAERQIGVTQTQWTGGPNEAWKTICKRDGAFARACHQAGVSCDPVPLAINKNCGNLGWCMTGCTRHGKASIDLQYLDPAEDRGALLLTGATALDVAPLAGRRRWQVRCQREGQSNIDTVRADRVVISAGAVGSPTILLRSAKNLPGGISAHTGRNLSRGGDMMLFGVLPDDIGDLEPLDTTPGKIIGVCSFQYMFEPPPGFGSDWRRFILQPMGVLPVLASILVADPHGITADGDMRGFGVGPKHAMQKFGNRLLQIGVMGMDGMDGQVTVNGDAPPSVSFNTSKETLAMQAAAKAGARHIMESAGGTLLPSWDEIRNDNVTIHPLGTCRMAASPTQGVLRHDCAVWKGDGTGVHEGLYVMDCSTMSSPIGVNTSLTTAAIAERACALALK